MVEDAGIGALRSGVVSASASIASDFLVHGTGDRLAGSFGGGFATGLVLTGFAVAQCRRRHRDEEDRRSCQERELAAGAAGMVVGAFAGLPAFFFSRP